MSAQTFRGYFDNPVPELTLDTDPASPYAQFLIRNGQAAILDAAAAAVKIIGQLSAWLVRQAECDRDG
ncbi:MAG: hypothetical protein WAV90_13845 [Gordonia amarae]